VVVSKEEYKTRKQNKLDFQTFHLPVHDSVSVELFPRVCVAHAYVPCGSSWDNCHEYFARTENQQKWREKHKH